MKEDIEVGMRCIKYMLFTTNFMFALIGFLLISVGSTITSIYNDFQLFMAEHYFSPAALMIAIGVIIFFVSLFGCFGAIRKSTCLINTYGVLLGMILILELSAAIAAYSMRSNIVEYVDDAMTQSLRHYKDPVDGEYNQKSWDFLQDRLECCGIEGSDDWNNLVGDMSPPESCIDNTNRVLGNSNYYKSGCLRKLSFIVSECAGLVGTGGICVAIVQLLGVIFAFMLAKSIRRLKTAAEVQRQENQRFYAQLASGNGNSEKPSPVLYTSQHTEA